MGNQERMGKKDIQVGNGVPDGPKIVGEPLAAPVDNAGRGLLSPFNIEKVRAQ